MSRKFKPHSLRTLKKVLDYDHVMGGFRFKKRFPLKDNKSFNSNFANNWATDTFKSKCDGLRGTVLGKEYSCERLVWFFETGVYPTRQVMFKNNDPYDTRYCNLYLKP